MVASDLVYYNSLLTDGGAIDLASPITTGQLNNLFPDVSAVLAENGGKVYRKLFLKNTHGVSTALATDLVMTRFSDAGDYVELFVATDTDILGDIVQSIGTGNDALVTFSDTLATTPLLPYSVTVTADTIIAVDDGLGALSGTGVTSGTIDYATGAISITYDVAPTTAVDIGVTYRDTLDKMYGIAKANVELDRPTKTVTVDVEAGQTLANIFSDGDKITFLDNSTGQKIVKATIAVGGVGASGLTIEEDIPPEVILDGAYIGNTIVLGDIASGTTKAVWARMNIPAFSSAYTNSYFGVNAIFVSS